MVFIRISKPWHVPENRITAEASYFNRRRFLKTLAGASIGLSATALTGCQMANGSSDDGENPLMGLTDLAAPPNSNFTDVGRPLTGRNLAATYNNFYEFGGTKMFGRPPNPYLPIPGRLRWGG